MTKRIDDPPRICEQCGASYVRQRMPCGQMTPRPLFLKRKYCGLACTGKARVAKPAPKPDTWQDKANAFAGGLRRIDS